MSSMRSGYRPSRSEACSSTDFPRWPLLMWWPSAGCDHASADDRTPAPSPISGGRHELVDSDSPDQPMRCPFAELRVFDANEPTRPRGESPSRGSVPNNPAPPLPDSVLEAVAVTLDKAVPYDFLSVSATDPLLGVVGQVLVRCDDDEAVAAIEPLIARNRVAESVARSGETRVVNDAHLNRVTREDPGVGRKPHSLIAAATRAGGELNGAVCLYRLGDDRPFTEHELHIVERFASLAG